MRSTTTCWLTGFAVALATMAVAVPAGAVTPGAVTPGAVTPRTITPATTAAPVTHRTVFATQNATLYRLALSSTGAVTSRTAVSGGAYGAAQDYDGRRLLFVRPGAHTWLDDQVWIREPSGASRFLAMGHLATFSPGRTGVALARFVAEGRHPDVLEEHDELSVYRLADGHVFPLSAQNDGFTDLRMRYSRDGKSLWTLNPVATESLRWLLRYDFAGDTPAWGVDYLPGSSECVDLEILPSGANALLACGSRLLTVRLDTGNVPHTTQLPAGTTVTSVDGRLNDRTLLLSLRDGSRQWLAGLDLDTFRTRTLAGSAGYHSAVAAY
jgi:hypothetical protein